MKIVCEAALYYCSLETFMINDIKADYDDFGYKMDTNHSIAEPYGCGNMEFIPNEPTQEILDKYNITEAEYKEICYRLVEELSYHKCGLCV